MKKLCLISFLTALLSSPAANAASFDCSQARTILEVLICADIELSTLDGQVGQLYSDARAQLSEGSTERMELLSAQREFLKERNQVCTIPLKADLSEDEIRGIISCLKVHYHIRLDALQKQLTDIASSRPDKFSTHTPVVLPWANAVPSAGNTILPDPRAPGNNDIVVDSSSEHAPVAPPVITAPSRTQANPLVSPNPTPAKAQTQTDSSSGWGNIIAIMIFGWILMKAFGKKVKKAPRKTKSINAGSGKLPNVGSQPKIDSNMAMSSTRQENKTRKNNTPASESDAKWILPGKTVIVAGHSISSGYIYVGTQLTVHGGGGSSGLSHVQEPALINPSLPVASRNPDTAGKNMGYWPSYSEISPACRLAYVQWLATGKCDPGISIGYVFLYFYGLERRTIIDRPATEEILLLAEEVKRLRGIYSSSQSFVNYSARLLEAADMIVTWRDSKFLKNIAPAIESSDETQRMRQLIALAMKMKEGKPLSFEWAMAGYLYAAGWHQRIAATRVRSVFLNLMRKRFEKKWPQGFKLRQRKSQFSYPFQGANQYVRLDLAEVLDMHSLPDPQAYDWSKLVEMAGQAENDLAAYARAVGRDPALAGAPRAILLLPSEIAHEQIAEISAPIISLLSEHHGLLKRVNMADLVQKIMGQVPVTLDTRMLRSIAEVMAQLGYGIEPDPDFGQIRPKINDTCIVFDAVNGTNPRVKQSAAYPLALSIAMLVAGVSGASGSGMGDDIVRWVGWIAKTLKLDDVESRRLHAHLMWLGDQRLSLAQVKRAISEVPADQRDAIAHLAASVAAADGIIEKSEVAFLEKLYDECGIERRKLYSTLHALAAAGSVAAREPVTMERSEASSGFKIRPAPDTQTANQLSRALDTSRIDKIMAETEQVSSVLTTIFAGEEEPASAVITNSSQISAETYSRFAGLNDTNAALAERLMTQDTWERSAFEALALELGLMPDGALEAINEWAYERFNEAFAEDGDRLEINRALIEETENNRKRSEAA